MVEAFRENPETGVDPAAWFDDVVAPATAVPPTVTPPPPPPVPAPAPPPTAAAAPRPAPVAPASAVPQAAVPQAAVPQAAVPPGTDRSSDPGALATSSTHPGDAEPVGQGAAPVGIPSLEALGGLTESLTTEQVARISEALARVRVRPGEEGLPPAVLFFHIVGPALTPRLLDGFGELIRAGVRGGDVVESVGDRAIAMACGGLFYPGDLEMIADRIRERVNHKAPVIMRETFAILVGGALSAADEDPVDLIERADRARAYAAQVNSPHVLIDYGLGPGVMPDE